MAIKQVELCPFIIAIDTREKVPYSFGHVAADSKESHRPVVVRTQARALATGDYSIVGFEDKVCVERKSLEDAYGTFGSGRKRFERELERMRQMDFAAVVIESSWHRLLHSPPARSQLRPKTVYRSILAWMQRYRVHFLLCESRSFSERTTFRLLERWHKDSET